MTKHSRPDICNPVRELSKAMDAPVPVHLKEMYKLIRFCIIHKGFWIKIQIDEEHEKVGIEGIE